MIFYVISVVVVFTFIKSREMDYRHGFVMVFLYLLFIALEILSEVGVI